jgi:hypothetical protein
MLGGAMRRMLTSLIIAFGIAGCQLMPEAPIIDCGQVPPAQCDEMVETLMRQANEEFPGKRVARIRLSTPTGGYDVEFTDGTGFAEVGH